MQNGPGHPRAAASGCLGSAPSTGHVLVAGRKKRDKASKHTGCISFILFFSLQHLFSPTFSSPSPPVSLFPSYFSVFVNGASERICLCFHQRDVESERGSLSSMTTGRAEGTTSDGNIAFSVGLQNSTFFLSFFFCAKTRRRICK